MREELGIGRSPKLERGGVNETSSLRTTGANEYYEAKTHKKPLPIPTVIPEEPPSQFEYPVETKESRRSRKRSDRRRKQSDVVEGMENIDILSSQYSSNDDDLSSGTCTEDEFGKQMFKS